MENKIAHYILEDLDEVHCSSCGHATRDILFLREDNDKFSSIYPRKCKNCGAEIAYLHIEGEGNEAALKEAIKNNNGMYSMLV